MEAIPPALVVLVGAPAVIGLVLVLANRRLPFAAGWALARWAKAEAWRAPFLAIVVGLAALAVAVWAVRLGTHALFFFFVVALMWFLVGVTGFEFDYTEEAGSEPGGRDGGWWRRSRY